MNKYITMWQGSAIAIMLTSLISCNAKQELNGVTTAQENLQRCPSNAPMFTESIANQVLTRWGKDLYQPNQTDLQTEAVYFVANNYTTDAVLVPTLSNKIRYGQYQILDYFYNHENHKPQGFITKHPIEATELPTYIAGANCGSGNYDGNYKFNLDDGHGGIQVVHARFSLMMQYNANPGPIIFKIDGREIVIKRKPGWYIGSQHSSIVPPT